MSQAIAIKFRFDILKATQAAHAFLRMAGGELNYLVLIKLLYLADRTALLELDAPITGDRLVSLSFGPVVSRILNLIRIGPANPEDEPWFDAVSPPRDYNVRAKADPAMDNLSNAEEQVIVSVFQKFGALSWTTLSHLTLQLPEWTDPGESSIPIAPEQILLLEGRTRDDLDRIMQSQLLLSRLDRDLAAFAREGEWVAA